MPSAPTRTAALLLVAFFLLILTSALCQAQGRHVFPLITDTLAVEMPDSFKIQAADSYGANAYAVWGTWGISPEGDTVCRLVGQLIVGATPVGEPVVIHSNAARPSNAVSVIALPTGFVVLWNDYRRVDSGEIHARVVRLNGSFTMPQEHPFADGAMKGSVETYGDAANGQVLRWTSVDGRTNLITIDNATRIVQPLRREGGEVLTQYYDGGILPDHTVLQLPGNRMVVIDERNARVLDDPPSYGRVFGHHHIDAAGRYSIIRGDTLITYPSIYDSIPLRSTVLDDLDSIAGGITILAGNDRGGVSAIYAKVMRDDIPHEFPVKKQMGTFWIALFEQKLDSLGVNQGTKEIRSFIDIEGNYIYNDRFFRFYRFESAGTSFTCGGIHVYYQIRKKHVDWSGSDAVEETTTLPLLCATVGREGGRTGAFGCTSSGGSLDCIVQRASGLKVSRLRSDSLSRVAVDLGDTTLTLEQKADVIGIDTTTVGVTNQDIEKMDSRSYPVTTRESPAPALITGSTDLVTLTPIPNPATSSIELRIRLTQSWPVTITIADESGRVVLRRAALSSTAGENRFTLEVGELMPGAYTVVLEAGTGRGEGRLVIVR